MTLTLAGCHSLGSTKEPCVHVVAVGQSDCQLASDLLKATLGHGKAVRTRRAGPKGRTDARRPRKGSSLISIASTKHPAYM